MRNHEVTQKQLLLDEQGEIREPGWAISQVWQYKRDMIKAPAFRIKEWDYYLVLADSYAAAFTISDDGYIGLQSVSLLKGFYRIHSHIAIAAVSTSLQVSQGNQPFLHFPYCIA